MLVWSYTGCSVGYEEWTLKGWMQMSAVNKMCHAAWSDNFGIEHFGRTLLLCR